MHMSMKRSLSFVAALIVLGGAALHASDVLTVLSSDVTQVGRPVVLNYRFVDTAMPEDMPRPSIDVDGLEIIYNGMQTQSSYSFNFGGGSSRSDNSTAFEFRYVVTPNRPGTFTIPAFDVRAGGKRIRTKPVTLRVVGSGGYVPPPVIPGPQQIIPPQAIAPGIPPGAPQAPARDEGGRPFYGEVVVGQKTAFVGEVVPVELRFYFRADLSFDNLQRPSFGGEGFTAADLSEPEQNDQVLNNVRYNVVTFRTAITPVKAGVAEIPPAAMTGRMVVQGSPFGNDPFFDQFFGGMPGMGRSENIEARTNRKKIEVLPLPKDGRPANFSGAIGQFTMDASASPKTTGPGEPVTLRLAVAGRGNFDTFTAPELTGTDGWRTYAPKESFAAEGSRGFGNSSGTKTFEFNMVARQDQTGTPSAQFSYFDPRDKKYVTLMADPVPVSAAGSGAGANDNRSSPPAAADAAAQQAPAQQGSAAAAPASASDIAAPAATLAKTASGFEAWIRKPVFLVINILLLLAVILSLPYLAWMRRRAKKSALASDLETTLRRARVGWQNTGERDVFYTAAAHFVLAQLALWDNKPSAQVDVEEALERRVADPVQRREILAVLAKHDELKYGGGGAGALDPQERARAVALMEKFAASHG